jgi:CobQ-like glutamine amidotransferase family enzyme
MTIRIVTVYPDLLGTYGDSGNGIVLEQRMKRRGLNVEHLRVNSHHSLPKADLYVIGGGEDGPQGLAAERLGNDTFFMEAVRKGAAIFAVCAGFQILTSSFVVTDGSSRPGLGLFDAETIRTDAPRAVGELVVRASAELGIGEVLLSGFENHGSRTTVGAGCATFATVLHGVGNGIGNIEGAIQESRVGTYLHGPALARNPDLADRLLVLAGSGTLSALDDERALDLRAERISSTGVAGANGRGDFAR